MDTNLEQAETAAEPHLHRAGEVVVSMGSDAVAGLSEREAIARLEKHGPNELPSAAPTTAWFTLWSQLKNILIVTLFVAIALSLALGHTLEAAAIGAIAFFSVVLGYVQERRAERALDALRRMTTPTAKVVRGEEEKRIPSRDLVPGDVILLSTGDVVPADARLLHALDLSVDEAPLTGESSPVDKDAEATLLPGVSLGDRANMVFCSTSVTRGRGRGVVTATGTTTEVGRIGRLLETVRGGKTPLERDLERLGRRLAQAAVVIVLVVVVLGVARGEAPVQMVIFGIALAVAVVPEALPAVVTISLALGAQRMARRNALIRRLPIVEALGSTTVICSDKTGTLTTGGMTVREVFVAGRLVRVSGAGYAPIGELREGNAAASIDERLRGFLTAAALCGDARLLRDETTGRWAIQGDPTEAALVVLATKAGLRPAEIEADLPRVGELAFTSERKRMTTLHRTSSGTMAVSKGAVEVVLGSCDRWVGPRGEAPLDDEARQAIHAIADGWASAALRVLAVARRAHADPTTAERGMTLLGLVGMIDPPRPEAKEAVERCIEAGIRPVMITGDHPLTARAIADELGILRGGQLITGAELDALDDETLRRRVDSIAVYARVSPSHKLRIVAALQAKGHVVAMTGDGANDAPALKKADVGVAMGLGGTDVAKEASGMTLTDDHFASIVAAVEEGRAVFDNVRKYVMYLVSSNTGEIALMAAAMLLGLPLPLTAAQILYVNLASDGLPALALAVDPRAEDLMRRRPRDPRGGPFSRAAVVLMMVGGGWSAIVNLGLFWWARASGRTLTEAMTLTFVSLVLIQFAKAYSFRSDRHTVFRRPFANRWLNRAILWEVALLLTILYVPFLREAFGAYPLTAGGWLLLGATAMSVIPILEVGKWMLRRGWLGPTDPSPRMPLPALRNER